MLSDQDRLARRNSYVLALAQAVGGAMMSINVSLGGLVGIALGLALAGFAANVLKVPFIFEPDIVIIAFVFSAVVGVVFGYFPARRAARLNPIEALRHE